MSKTTWPTLRVFQPSPSRLKESVDTSEVAATGTPSSQKMVGSVEFATWTRLRGGSTASGGKLGSGSFQSLERDLTDIPYFKHSSSFTCLQGPSYRADSGWLQVSGCRRLS